MSDSNQQPPAGGGSEVGLHGLVSRFSVAEIREWLEGWRVYDGDGNPARPLSLENILTLLDCDQDGIEAWAIRNAANSILYCDSST